MVSIGLLAGPALYAASLTPSPTAFDRQVARAEAGGYQRAHTPDDVYAEVQSGALVRLTGNGDYEVKSTVPLPFARPEVLLFVERLAAEYRASCSDRLVITSLVRPKSRQPRNAHPRSVHQLGLAMDLRRSWSRACRRWLEANLLHLESEGVLEATRERNPPHYHVALFTDPYIDYLARRESETSRLAAGSFGATDPSHLGYVVQQGDSLWRIASRHGVEVAALRDANGLRGTTISPGQFLQVPVTPRAGERQAAGTYRVRSGDTLWTIAKRYGTSPQRLQQANALRSSRIYPGQVLALPPTATTTPSRSSR
jgi:LysM repeat protein